MRELSRREYTQAFYSRKYPVLVIDTAQVKGDTIQGPKVAINQGPYHFTGRILAPKEMHRLEAHMDCTGLALDLVYDDMLDMYTAGTAPVIYPGKPVLLCVHNSKTKTWRDPVLLDTYETGNPDWPVRIEEYDVLDEP